MKTVPNPPNPDLTAVHDAPLDEGFRIIPAMDYTADMLQRTITPPPGPTPIDYLIVERIARDMRNEYIASLFARAKRALAARFAQGARRSTRRAPSGVASGGKA